MKRLKPFSMLDHMLSLYADNKGFGFNLSNHELWEVLKSIQTRLNNLEKSVRAHRKALCDHKVLYTCKRNKT